MTITIKNKEYPLANTLRVAYMLQGQHNHKPYTEIFSSMDKMPLEDQIGLVYTAFKCANPEDAKTITSTDFLNYYLDNNNLKDLMSLIKSIVSGIFGEDLDEENTDNKAIEFKGTEGN